VPTVTALRDRRGAVAVELDGAPWRTVPVGVAAEAGLMPGCELDRERARRLGRALRGHRAEQAALRALARREHSEATLAGRLERAGVRSRERDATVAAAVRTGLVDDVRFAESRARALAARGAGDLLVLDNLRRSGVDESTAREAVGALEPEAARASRVAASRGASVQTLRYLASRGFGEESLEQLVAELESRALG
jgi:SOS response regulatory protein OraA/RecX